MKPTITEWVKVILADTPETRDDNGLLSLHFLKRFEISPRDFILSNMQCSIRTCRQNLQREFPELRGEWWVDRQKNSNKFKEKLRNNEMPEELDRIY